MQIFVLTKSRRKACLGSVSKPIFPRIIKVVPETNLPSGFMFCGENKYRLKKRVCAVSCLKRKNIFGQVIAINDFFDTTSLNVVSGFPVISKFHR